MTLATMSIDYLIEYETEDEDEDVEVVLDVKATFYQGELEEWETSPRVSLSDNDVVRIEEAVMEKWGAGR